GLARHLHGDAHRTESHSGARDRRRADGSAGRSRSLSMDGRADFFRKEFVLGFYCDRRSGLDSHLRSGADRKLADAVARAVERGNVLVMRIWCSVSQLCKEVSIDDVQFMLKWLSFRTK